MATFWNRDLAHEHNFQGVGTGLIEILHPPEAEDEGKTRRQCLAFCGETPASRAVRMLFPNFQALFCEPLPRLTDV
jgi:hypothetical protein